MSESTSRVMEIDIDDILPNRFQPRIQFDEEEILELSDSIREHGVIQPIVVRPLGDKYEIVSGERRYKASVLAGKETMPVIIRNLNDKESAEIALIENVQRKSLTPIEEALSYKKILDMGYITQENLASKIGKSQSSVANKIRLLNLSDEVQDALLENKISERHARSLLKLTEKQQQNYMLNKIITERLTVRKTDEEIAKLLTKEESLSESRDSQKIIEKGENTMNNTMFGMPNASQQPESNSFDIFATPQTQEASNMASPVENNTMFGMPPQSATPKVPNMSSPVENNTMFGIPSQPVAPEVPNMSQPVENNTMFGIPSQPVAPEVPNMSSPVENNTIFGIPSQPVAPKVPNMSQPVENNTMFGIPSQPAAPEVPNMASPVENNTMFGMPSQPAAPEVPNMASPVENNTMFGMPSQPAAPEVPNMPQPVENNTMFGMPSQPAAPEVPNMPTPVENNTIFEMPAQPAAPEVPNMSSPVENNTIFEMPAQPATPEVPVTAPIIESSEQVTQQSENLFSFGEAPKEEISTPEVSQTSLNQQKSEFKVPEPIIITDYSKQYDPVMPQTDLPATPKVEFKEVISTIRECSKKIEQYGFTLDVEEYDLENIYQVIFKINK